MDALDKNTVAAAIAEISLGDGWTATVSLAGDLSVEDWRKYLADPETLTDDPQRVIRTGGSTGVITKTISPGGKPISVVIKDEVVKGGLRSFFRSYQPAKSKRNFRLAQKLLRNKIPVVAPLAALEKKHRLRAIRSIYITGYCPNSDDMLSFVRDDDGKTNFDDPEIKKQFLNQLVVILAMLDKNGMWHRDAKAGNFLVVVSDGKYAISLLDMDGIKKRWFNLFAYRLRVRTLAKLVSTMLWNPFVTRSDYLRAMTLYCTLIGINKDKRKKLFKDVSKTAVAMRLVTIAKSSRAGSNK